MGSAISSWNIPGIFGFKFSGIIWILISGILYIPALISLRTFKGLTIYLVFICYSLISLMWLDIDINRSNVQDIVQLTVPILPWVIAVRLSNFRLKRIMSIYISIKIIFVTQLLILVPTLFKIYQGIELTSTRPASITMSILAGLALGHFIDGVKLVWLA